jgi:hypothetical protein
MTHWWRIQEGCEKLNKKTNFLTKRRKRIICTLKEARICRSNRKDCPLFQKKLLG